jgi:hypothetical protein
MWVIRGYLDRYLKTQVLSETTLYYCNGPTQ